MYKNKTNNTNSSTVKESKFWKLRLELSRHFCRSTQKREHWIKQCACLFNQKFRKCLQQVNLNLSTFEGDKLGSMPMSWCVAVHAPCGGGRLTFHKMVEMSWTYDCVWELQMSCWSRLHPCQAPQLASPHACIAGIYWCTSLHHGIE